MMMITELLKQHVTVSKLISLNEGSLHLFWKLLIVYLSSAYVVKKKKGQTCLNSTHCYCWKLLFPDDERLNYK